MEAPIPKRLPSPNRLRAGRPNSNRPNSKQILLGHLKLEFGAYLGFGNCDLEFLTLCPMRYAATGEGDLKMVDRKKLEETILAKSKEGKIPCAVCFKIADDLGIPKKEITKVLNEMKIKISQCQLGCFD